MARHVAAIVQQHYSGVVKHSEMCAALLRAPLVLGCALGADAESDAGAGAEADAGWVLHHIAISCRHLRAPLPLLVHNVVHDLVCM